MAIRIISQPGTPGPAGPAGPAGPGRIVTWSGPGTAYVAGQAVVSAGQTSIAVDDHVSGATFAGDAAHWVTMAGTVPAGGGTGFVPVRQSDGSILWQAGPTAASMGPMVVSAMAVTTTDQRALVQTEIDNLHTAGGGTLLLTSDLYLRSLSTRAHGGTGSYTTIFGNIDAGLHIPESVCLESLVPGDKGRVRIIADSAVFNTSNAYILHNTQAGSGKGPAAKFLRNIEVSCTAAAPTAWSTQSIPPTDCPRAVLVERSGMDGVWFSGKIRCGIHARGQHCVHVGVTGGGWAAIERGPFVNDADDAYMFGNFQGAYCNVYVPSGLGFSGHSFWRCHFGQKGPMFFVDNPTANFVSVQGLDFFRCSFEGGARGLFVDDSKIATFQDINFYTGGIGATFDGGYAPTDRPGSPDALIRCATLRNMKVYGDAGGFLQVGYDPVTACAIDAVTVQGCELGDITHALAQADSLGVPLIRASSVQGTTGYFFPDRGFEQKTRVHFRKSTTAISRGDAFRKRASNNSATGQRFDAAGKPVAGVAAQTLPANNIVPIVDQGPIQMNTVRSGSRNGAATVTLPFPAVTGTATLSAALALGTGALIPRLLEDAGFSGLTTLKLTGIGDLPTGGGTFSLGNSIFTYTDATQDPTTTEWQLNGVSPAVTMKQFGGGTPLGLVAPLTGPPTNFSATGGVAKSGTTYFAYNGVSGNNLIGVSDGTGTLASGAAITDCLVLALTGSEVDYPTAFASATFGTAPFAQFNYAAVVRDRITQWGGTRRCYLADITGTVGTGSYGTSDRVMGGTRLNGAITLPAATIPIRDGTILRSGPGTALIGGQTVAYNAVAAGQLTGCAGGTGTIADGSPVSMKPGTMVAADSLIRPGFTATTAAAGDQGVVAAASGPADPDGVRIGHANGGDTGPVVLVDVG